MMAVNPAAVMPAGGFANHMRSYVEYVETSHAIDELEPPRYPGRREGENWLEYGRNGIPVSAEALERLDSIAAGVSVARMPR